MSTQPRKTALQPTLAKGLDIPRRYTKAGRDPFTGIEFTKVDSVIYNANGSVNFEMKGVEVPASWDKTAVDILASKYLRKAGVPQTDASGAPLLEDGVPVLGAETSSKQWALRIANAWRIWGERGGYFATTEDAEAFRDEMAFMIMNQVASPNSPQHFNTGLFESYGITGDPEGNSYYDEDTDSVVYSKTKHERSAVNACYIQSVQDELVGPDSIFDLIEKEARLFKAGSGTGTNFSNVRGVGEPLSGGGSSSGVMSFIKVSDAAAGAIKSGGTTRRAAKMIILDADHPDIEEFIWAKAKEEKKVAALVAGGYDASWTGEAYQTVAFQNFNGSVRLPKGFMDAVRADANWELTARTSGKVMKTLKARDLWDQIAEAAWTCADPGVQFDDLLNDWNTAPNDGRLRGTNPCSEYTHIDDTACNLASLNLAKFFDPETQVFDVEAYRHAARLFTLALEISVSMSHYPSESVARNSFEHRTLGLGYANLGSLLMQAGIAYDSPEGVAVAGALTAIMHDTAYATSAEMAASIGPCRAYLRNAEPMARVIRNHARAAYGTRLSESDLGEYEGISVRPVGVDHRVLGSTVFAPLSDVVVTAARAMLNGLSGGFRNMQVTVLAPTGTIGLQMGCATTGVEPDFALVKFKSLSTGGFMKIVNSAVPFALKALGYSQEESDRIMEHALGSQSFDGPTAVNRGSLKANGLTDEDVDRVESFLPQSTELPKAFARYIIGETTLERLGFTPEQYLDDSFDLLSNLGFTQSEIFSSSDVICGHQTLEGAADLKEEHLPVFDTANYCGDGTRVIAWQGHVRMLGAVAPHLSGSASKTINMPNEAMVQDVKDAYELSYALGVKCNAIYRDGSKMSQVLTSQKSKAEAEEEVLGSVTSALDAAAALIQQVEPGISPTAFYQQTSPPKFKVPDVTDGPNFKFKVGGTKVFLNCGEYGDGTLAEVFITVGGGKEGTLTSSMFTCFAIAISMGLQYGVPLERFVEMFTWHNFQPSGIVEGNPNLKMSTSIIDAIFKVLAFHYLERDDLVQVPGPRFTRVARTTATPGALRVNAPAVLAPLTRDEVSKQVAPALDAHTPPRKQAATGSSCHKCGGQMVRSGTCERCLTCGETTGCS